MVKGKLGITLPGEGCMENETSIKIGRGWVKNVRAWPFPFTQQPLTIQLRIDLFLAHAISPDNIKWHISFSLRLYTTPASLSPLQEVIALQITIHSPFSLTLYSPFIFLHPHHPNSLHLFFLSGFYLLLASSLSDWNRLKSGDCR